MTNLVKILILVNFPRLSVAKEFFFETDNMIDFF